MKYILFFFFLLTSLVSYGQRNDTISLKTYLDEKIFATSVEPKSGVLTVNGYLNNKFVTRKILLNKNEVLAVINKKVFPQLSLVTIPFKVRGSIDTLPQNVQTGLTNASLNFSLINFKMTRYFSSGDKSTHLFGLGLLVGPSAEELSPSNTKNKVNNISKQLFISTGLSFTYSYNDLTFALIPLGLDFATTNDGKNYIYNKKRWWGLGIGIKTQLLGLF